jgi:hypothetical protein
LVCSVDVCERPGRWRSDFCASTSRGRPLPGRLARRWASPCHSRGGPDSPRGPGRDRQGSGARFRFGTTESAPGSCCICRSPPDPGEEGPDPIPDAGAPRRVVFVAEFPARPVAQDPLDRDGAPLAGVGHHIDPHAGNRFSFRCLLWRLIKISAIESEIFPPRMSRSCFAFPISPNGPPSIFPSSVTSFAVSRPG